MAAAVIIAGGRGSRLGGAIKSELVVGGVRLLDRVWQVLAGCEPILVAHGGHEAAVLRLPAGLVPVADLDTDYGGPLAGFAAAIDWLNVHRPDMETLVAAAVDTPYLPEDFVTRLMSRLTGQQAAVAAYAGQAYPTNSAWRLPAIRDLPARVRDGVAPRSLKALAASLRAADVAWPESEAGDPFANINLPSDLDRFESSAD